MDSQQIIHELNRKLEEGTAEQCLQEVLGFFKGKIRFSSSLGAEDQVITALLASIDKQVEIFTLDTGRMFPETYDVLHRTTNRYGVRINVCFPDAGEVQEMVNSKGINLFYESIENRKLCCQVRKINPLKKALEGADAWITGLRRQQSVTRTSMRMIEWDDNHQLIKVNPLIEWTDQQVWDYIHKHNVPYNKLHDQGYPSIGCQPCTRAVLEGEDIRAGRWWWELPDSKECGLHKK
jgi:phosphoadenosine phosphosulfate reductase